MLHSIEDEVNTALLKAIHITIKSAAGPHHTPATAPKSLRLTIIASFMNGL